MSIQLVFLIKAFIVFWEAGFNTLDGKFLMAELLHGYRVIRSENHSSNSTTKQYNHKQFLFKIILQHPSRFIDALF